MKRALGIDAIKGFACLVIVLHHLAFYGPMSDVAAELAPAVAAWLFDYGRFVVQTFLVLGGYMAAASLAPNGVFVPQRGSLGALIWRRYRRLVRPYLAAVTASVLIAALVRPWFRHASVPDAPTAIQLVSHVLLLTDILGLDALSAGLWYVAIDFQLYALSALIFSGCAQAKQRWPVLPVPRGDRVMAALGMASLLLFNRHTVLDATALYFLGSYVLGMMAYWAAAPQPTASHVAADSASAQAPGRRAWFACLLLAGTAALVLDYRGRIALAVGTAIVLVWLHRGAQVADATAVSQHPARWQVLGGALVKALASVGAMSYAVFLIHFSVCLLVNAVVSHVWPTHVLANCLGLLAAVALSLLAGKVLHQQVDTRSVPQRTHDAPMSRN